MSVRMDMMSYTQAFKRSHARTTYGLILCTLVTVPGGQGSVSRNRQNIHRVLDFCLSPQFAATVSVATVAQ